MNKKQNVFDGLSTRAYCALTYAGMHTLSDCRRRLLYIRIGEDKVRLVFKPYRPKHEHPSVRPVSKEYRWKYMRNIGDKTSREIVEFLKTKGIDVPCVDRDSQTPSERWDRITRIEPVPPKKAPLVLEEGCGQFCCHVTICKVPLLLDT